MKHDKDILELQFKILVEAISAIDISSVDAKNPKKNNVMLYIETKNLNTVDKDKLDDICKRYSDENILVTYIIPTGKVRDNKEIPNTDMVCIFIEK